MFVGQSHMVRSKTLLNDFYFQEGSSDNGQMLFRDTFHRYLWPVVFVGVFEYNQLGLDGVQLIIWKIMVPRDHNSCCSGYGDIICKLEHFGFFSMAVEGCHSCIDCIKLGITLSPVFRPWSIIKFVSLVPIWLFRINVAHYNVGNCRGIV